MKAILIARVSTEEQKEAGNSLPAQIARLEKYCQIKGFPILQVFSFDESAHEGPRDEFNGIIDFVLAQKKKLPSVAIRSIAYLATFLIKKSPYFMKKPFRTN